MFYKLRNGTLIQKVGKQNMNLATVPISVNGETVDCPMFMDEDGDIGFTCQGEDVLFHWMKYQPY